MVLVRVLVPLQHSAASVPCRALHVPYPFRVLSVHVPFPYRSTQAGTTLRPGGKTPGLFLAIKLINSPNPIKKVP